MLARGEFALILVSLAAAAGLDARLSPFVAMYVLILAVASPVLAARSGHLAKLFPTRWFPPDYVIGRPAGDLVASPGGGG